MAALCATLLFVSLPCWANGRFPRAQQVVVAPGSPSLIALSTTFGLVLSQDGGDSWSWICEEVVGGELNAIVYSAAQELWAAPTFQGLYILKEGGCSLQQVEGTEDKTFRDVSLVPEQTRKVLALESTLPPGEGPTTRVWTGSPGGSLTKLGTEVDSPVLAFTLDAAPSAPAVLYLTGISTEDDNYQGVLLRSEDTGASWEQYDIPKSGAQRPPFLAAVHPSDPQRLYVRLAGSVVSGAVQAHVLLESRDGGRTFKEVYSAAAEMRGFALSPDGARVHVGMGIEPGSPAPDPAALGLFSASTEDFKFERLGDTPVHCLKWSMEGLLSCGLLESTGYDLGRSSDDGKSFEELLRRTEIQPLECGEKAAPVVETCAASWKGTCVELGLSCGSTSSTGDLDGGADSGMVTALPAGNSSCNCHTAAAPHTGLWRLWIGVFGLAWRRRIGSVQLRRA